MAEINYAMIGELALHPLQRRILNEFAACGPDAEFSPSGLAGILGEPLGNVSYHVSVLSGNANKGPSRFAENPLLLPTRTEPRRGAVEHYYHVALDTLLPAPPASWWLEEVVGSDRKITVDQYKTAVNSWAEQQGLSAPFADVKAEAFTAA